MPNASGLSLMSINSDLNRPESDLRCWYSGYLIVGHLSEGVTRKVADLVSEFPGFEVTSTAIELEYKGRDSSRAIVRALLRLARLIENADGEVRCQIEGDSDQLWFEFYWIRDRRLFRQRADVVRQPEREVTEVAL
ncbi:MAG: hypothetical protein IT178_07115 [Acidobacteria bacterium]|nr:hypothetical protein [Acidobacteriota bacterium]